MSHGSAQESRCAASTTSGDEIPILNLHGSVNWALSYDQGCVNVFDGYTQLLQAGGVPALVPPTWNKVFHGPIGDIWQGAIGALRQATRLIVIGFSLPPTDLHFKYLLAAGLQENMSLRQIVFCDPDGDAVKKRARSLLRQEYIDARQLIVFTNQGLAEFLVYRFSETYLFRRTTHRIFSSDGQPVPD